MRSYTSQELKREEIKIRDQRAADYVQATIEYMGRQFDSVERQTVLDWLRPTECDVILDAGCGVGRLTISLARRCRKVYAIDYSPQSIAVLNEHLEKDQIDNVETLIGDITQPLPVPEQMDGVVSVQTIQHIPSEEERWAAVGNLHGLLRKDGRLVLTAYNYFPRQLKHRVLGRTSDQEFLARKYHDEEEERQIGLYCYRFLAAELRQMLEKLEFKDIKLGGCNNIPRPLCRLVGRQLMRLDIALSQTCISSYLGAYLIARGTK
jgi:2-polyprenyl-3-methyl-5-hydroxy-6-metoxy-1,4-benzoquinol methylase